MAEDGTDDEAAPVSAGDAAMTMVTMELGYVEGVVDFILWDTPTTMIPTAGRVWDLARELLARPDVADPIVQRSLAQCWVFLGFDSTVCHYGGRPRREPR